MAEKSELSGKDEALKVIQVKQVQSETEGSRKHIGRVIGERGNQQRNQSGESKEE